MPLNVAIVGAGNIGNTHAKVYQQHPECVVVAFCDVFEDKAKEAAAKYDCQSFGSIKAMLGERP